MSAHAEEVASGGRFEFGKNWARFLDTLDEGRIATAEASLCEFLRAPRLDGKRFLDAGCGSGIFSLAARRLGADVLSFDYDPHSAACARELKRRYFPGDPGWEIREGSVLDRQFLGGLGEFDVVYSWGVLHHTGAMWDALANVAPLARPGGQLFVSIYNDQGTASRRWLAVKKLYNRVPGAGKTLLAAAVAVQQWWRPVLKDTLRADPGLHWRQYRRSRGMSPWHDVVDWVGGYPFEVAKPEQIFEFYREKGFRLERLTTCAGALGCNQFVFRAP